MPLWSLLRRELNIVSVEMTDWRMTVELYPGGRHSFPKFRRQEPSGGKSPITVSVAYVRTRRGQFTFQDHGTPWGTVVRNLDITVLKLVGYRGYSTSSGGTVTVQSYTPMAADLRTWFRIDGGKVILDRIELDTDGAKSIADRRRGHPALARAALRDRLGDPAGDAARHLVGPVHLHALGRGDVQGVLPLLQRRA